MTKVEFLTKFVHITLDNVQGRQTYDDQRRRANA